MDTFDSIQETLDIELEDELLYSEAGLLELKVSELKEILKSLDLPIYGTKEVLVKRLFDNREEEVLKVESTIIIKKETNDAGPQTAPGYVEPVKGTRV